MTDNQATPGGDDRTGASYPSPAASGNPQPSSEGPTGPVAPSTPPAGMPPAPMASAPGAPVPGVPQDPRVPLPPPPAAAFDPTQGWGRPQPQQPGQPSMAPPPGQPPMPPQPPHPAMMPPHAGQQPTAPQPPVAQPYGPGYPGQGHPNPYPPSPTHQWTIPIPGQPVPQPQSTGPKLPAWLTTKRALIGAAAALAIALPAGAIGGVVGYAMHPSSGSPLQVSASTGNGNAAPVINRDSLASIAAAVQPAIVDITTDQGEGSGVIISADGNIVTNNHVVEGASTVTVTFNSGKQLSGHVVGTDPKTDLAVIKTDTTGLTYAAWEDSNAVQVGDTVLAIGSPLGLQGSVTAGIVSALHRTITEGSQSNANSSSGTTIGDAIQTDAPINPGNSGGALVDTNGKVIGINSAIATSGTDGNIGVGFAISANKAKAVADALIAGQKVSHPYLGVQIADASSGGAKITSVVAGGPADQAGIKTGDIVTKVGSRTIRGAEDLIGAIQTSTVGSQLPVTVQRGGSETTVNVTVGEQ
jgi:putative serine protease PepD